MFIEQAYKGDNSWWKVLITFLLTGGIFIIGLLVWLVAPKEIMESASQLNHQGPASIPMFLLSLLPFAFFLGLLFLLVKFLHERSILSLTTSRASFDFRRFLFVIGLVAIVYAVSFGIDYFGDPESVEWSFNPGRFWIFFVLSLILLPFQIGYEEYLFRGFVIQQSGIFFRNRWMPLLLSSLFFGLAHAANPEIYEMGNWLLVYYIGTGLFLGIIVLMDEGLELTLGFHLANNFFSVILVSYDHSALQSETLFRYTSDPDPKEMLTANLASVAIVYPILLFILSRRFGWSGWKRKLTGRVAASNPQHPQTQSIEP